MLTTTPPSNKLKPNGRLMMTSSKWDDILFKQLKASKDIFLKPLQAKWNAKPNDISRTHELENKCKQQLIVDNKMTKLKAKITVCLKQLKANLKASDNHYFEQLLLQMTEVTKRWKISDER